MRTKTRPTFHAKADQTLPGPQLELQIFAVCRGYWSFGECLRTAREGLIKQGLTEHHAKTEGVQYFAVPKGSRFVSHLTIEYPETSNFRMTKLGTL